MFPDFTTTLTKGKYTLDSIMSQLRVTYDGDANRITGMDTQRREPWNGKVGVLLAVTDEIERFKKKASGLGERFLYFRHTIPEFDTLGFKSKTPNKFPKEEYATESTQQFLDAMVALEEKIQTYTSLGV